MPTPPTAEASNAAVELDRVARAFRAAVIAREGKRAARLSQAYGLAVARAWKSLSARERANSPLPAQTLELLGWAQKTVAADRHLAAQHLAAIHKARQYRQPGPGFHGVEVRA